MKRINITCPACGSRAYLRPASVVYGDKAPDPDAKYYVCGRYQAAHPPPDDAFDALRARLLLHDLFLLADEEQALLIRHRLHGCSLAETARREGMSVKRVRHRLKALYRAYFTQKETKQKEL